MHASLAVPCRAVRSWQVTLIELTVLELVRTLIVSEHSNFGVAAYSFYPCARARAMPILHIMITVIVMVIVILMVPAVIMIVIAIMLILRPR